MPRTTLSSKSKQEDDMAARATVTRTRSGNLRGSVDPQAVARELDALKADNAALRARVEPLEAALAPAFPPKPAARQRQRDPYVPQSWCGEGGCRPASPCASCAQAGPGHSPGSHKGTGWREDYEHSDGFLARAGSAPVPETPLSAWLAAHGAADADTDPAVPLAALRKQSADNDAMTAAQAARQAAEPVTLWQSRAFCAAPGCRPGTPCARCTGQLNRVADKSGETMGGREQRTLVHASVPPLGSERPGYVNPGIGGWS